MLDNSLIDNYYILEDYLNANSSYNLLNDYTLPIKI